MDIIYYGFNSFKTHKRGVENVIDFQMKSHPFKKIYYLHWGEQTYAYRHNGVISISLRNYWTWPFIFNKLIFKIKKRNKSVIVHSHNTLLSLFSIFRTEIFTVHDGLYYQNRVNGHRFSKLFWLLEHLLYPRCKMVHFISKYTKSQSLFGNRNNYLIIPNTSHFEDIAGNIKNKISKHLDVLIVRSIENRARFDLVLEVAAKLGDDYNFIVAGKGPLLEYFRNTALQSNIKNITFLGYVTDLELIQLYKNCKLVLNIAEYAEGFGLPIIEAYLFNKPVIASNRCAIPEIIINKDYLFENNIQSIASLIKKVLNNLNDNDEYRKYYFGNFSNLKIETMMNQVYSKLKP